MLQSMTIELPVTTYQRLEQLAQRKNRTIPELVDTLVGEDGAYPALPPDIVAELNALNALPNDVLLTLVRYPFPMEQQKELADLIYQAQTDRMLSVQEKQRQIELAELSNRAILRRTHCLDILSKRGYALESLLEMPDALVI